MTTGREGRAVDEKTEILNLRGQLLFEELSSEKKVEICARLKAMRWTKSWDCPVCGGAPCTIAADGQLKCSDCRHWWKPS